MKRIAIVAIGSWGDVGPLITLGAGLADAGYEVVLVTHAAYAEDAGRAGLDFAPLSGDPVAIPEDEHGRQWLETGGNGLRFALHLVRIARPLQRAVLDESYAACAPARRCYTHRSRRSPPMWPSAWSCRASLSASNQ